jgi:hypothetical protein
LEENAAPHGALYAAIPILERGQEIPENYRFVVLKGFFYRLLNRYEALLTLATLR